MADVLRRCRRHLSNSEASDWSCTDAEQIILVIDDTLRSLADGHSIDVHELQVLFAPTGALQETAMTNGWSDDYLELADQFDSATETWDAA